MILYLSITMFSHRLKMRAQPGSSFSLIQTPGSVLALPEYDSPACLTWQNVFVHTIVPYAVEHLLHPSLEVTALLGWVKGFL